KTGEWTLQQLVDYITIKPTQVFDLPYGTLKEGAVVVFFFFKQETAYDFLLSLVGSEMCIRSRSHRRAFMNNKDLIDETGWTLTEIINRINSLPHIKQKITQEDLQNMSKVEFQEMIIGHKSSTERSNH
ncbi:hypothetical protein BU686_03645, partial [Staphylococcus chromogenes]